MAILQKYGILTNPAYDEGAEDSTPPPVEQAPVQAAPAQQAPEQAPLPMIRQPRPVYQPNPLRMAQERRLQQGIMQQENRPAATGFWGKAGHIISNVANAAGNVILGGANMAMIPGTQLHDAAQHNAAVGELQGLEKQDQQEEQQFGQEQLRGAQTHEAEARANSLENPPDKPDKFTFQQTDHGLMRIDSTTGEARPVTFNGQVLQPKDPAEKDESTKTADLLGPDGKEHIMGWDAKTKKFDVDMGLKGEKPAAAPGTTVIIPNGQGGGTVQRLTPGQTVAPGAMTPAGFNSLSVPTSSTRTMVETAPRVIELADRVEQLIDRQVQTLGPAASRWAEFMAGKVGAPNPQFTALRTNVGLLSTALMRMHVGARGGEQIMQHFADLIDSSKQSPENLKAALEEIKQYANQVKTEVPGGRTQEHSNAQPTRPANVPEGYLFKDGPKGKGWYKP